MMLRAQRGMAGQALSAIERDPFFGRWRMMWFVATHARHRRARLLLTHALRQGFELTRRPQAERVVVSSDVIPNIVGQLVSGTELIQMPSRTLNCSIALQVTLHTRS